MDANANPSRSIRRLRVTIERIKKALAYFDVNDDHWFVSKEVLEYQKTAVICMKYALQMLEKRKECDK